MTDDREPFREARVAGLKARQERRLENATYTAAEVKVLTEAALRLGRKEAGEEIAAAITAHRDADDSTREFRLGLSLGAKFARDIAALAAPDASTARTEAPGYSDLPQDSQAVRNRILGDFS